MKSRYTGADTSVNGKGVRHRKLSQEEKACVIADILAGDVPYMPSQGELCARFGVSSFLVRQVQKLSRAINGPGAANGSGDNGNGDANVATSNVDASSVATSDLDTSVTIEELTKAEELPPQLRGLRDVPPSLIRAWEAADADEREWFVRSKISELWNPVTHLISYVIS